MSHDYMARFFRDIASERPDAPQNPRKEGTLDIMTHLRFCTLFCEKKTRLNGRDIMVMIRPQNKSLNRPKLYYKQN